MHARIALCIMNLGVGGAQRAMVTLANALFRRGAKIDIIVAQKFGAYQHSLPPNTRITTVGKSTLAMAIGLRRFCNANPDVTLISAQTNISRVLGLLKLVKAIDNHVIIREPNRIGSTVKGALRFWRPLLPLLYRQAEGIVAVSQAGKDDLAKLTGWPESKISLIGNATDHDYVVKRAREPLPEPWLSELKNCRYVLGAGRLVEQKDFPTLISAFAKSGLPNDVKLVILGEGRLRGELERLTETLGIAKRVLMPGFQENPFSWMSRAELFVLSSRWEGSPNALIEALATGTPCIATNCPSGPSEILSEPLLGRLVPVGNSDAMARELAAILSEPDTREERETKAREKFGVEPWADRYVTVINNCTTQQGI
ncbi:glycosyltransferase [uncultured Devosia sp.]|uniref:glycosyltransferase n=1 Tax=uncultured Devosia sp. TaxID=211434 RepID=UPI00263578C5|nr:glycosyltransferase [uncultured Devosia sp.]